MNKNKWDDVDTHVEIRFMETVRSGLDDEVKTIDGDTLERLSKMRMSAVSSETESYWADKISRFASVHGWLNLPAAQVSVAMLVAVFSMSLLLSPGSPLRPEINVQQDNFLHSKEHALGEVDVLMSNEDMEFLENLEVYEWLVAEYG